MFFLQSPSLGKKTSQLIENKSYIGINPDDLGAGLKVAERKHCDAPPAFPGNRDQTCVRNCFSAAIAPLLRWKTGKAGCALFKTRDV